MTEYTNRVAHYLKPLSSTKRLTRCIYFDTETTQHDIGNGEQEHRLKLGWAVSTRRKTNGDWTKGIWFKFTDADSFWEWIDSQVPNRTLVTIWAHNCDFDFGVVEGIIKHDSHGWEIVSAVIDSPPFFIKMRKGTKTVMFCCSLNIFREKLEVLGKKLGITKGDWADVAKDDAALSDYCRRDVEILRAIIEQWQQFVIDNDFGSFTYTLASQAFTAYRHKYLTKQIFIESRIDPLELARSAYKGARTECFFIGVIDVFMRLLDVNSMYPFVMSEFKYPTKLLSYRTKNDVRNLRYFIRNWGVVCDCEISINQPAIAMRKDDKLIFPTGRFRTVLTTPEIEWVHKQGRIVKVHRTALYEMKPIFTDFITDMYDKRLTAQSEGNEVYAWLFKILMNSLYGKFGQNGIRWETTGYDEVPRLKIKRSINAQTLEITYTRQVGRAIQTRESIPESRYSHPAIAAHVTAYARLLLWDLMIKAGTENVYYCDTDSLLVNEKGYKRLQRFLDDTKLGALKVDHTFDHGVIYAAKDYEFGDKKRTKGVRQNAEWLTENTVRQMRWQSMKTRMQNGDTGLPKMGYVVKKLSRIYTKGDVDSKGLVTPFRLGSEC